MKNARAFLVAIGLALFSLQALTQPATGTYPDGSFTGGPDVVNLGNLNANLTIPIVNKPGRGQNFVYNLTYDSSVWYPVGSSGSQSWQPVNTTSWWGWRGLSAPAFGGTVTYSVSTSSGQCGQYGQNSWEQWTYSNIIYTDPTGGTHSWIGTVGVYISSTGSMCPPTGASPSGPTVAVSNDGSGYSAEWQISSSGIAIQMLTRTGNTITPGASSGMISEDANGNEITLSGGVFTDTLGQTALSMSSGSTTTLSNGNPSGNPYTVSYTSYNIKTNFGCPGISEYSASNVNLVNQVSLPDGRSYSFTYENTPGYSGYKTGRVASVTLPTGGTISYAYTGGSNGIVCADGSTAGLTRTTPDGTWTYARSGSGTQWTTTVTAPTYNTVQNQTVSKFLTTGATSGADFYEIERQVYAGSSSSGTLLETLLTCYETNPSNCSSSIGDSGTSVSTSALSRIQKTAQLPGGSGSISSGTLDTLDAYGSNLTHAIYDFASGTSYGSLLQTTTTTYTTSYGGDRPTEVKVTDAVPSTVSDTVYGYGTTVVATSGTPNHYSGYNLGNLIYVGGLVSGSTYQYAYYSYYDTGNVYVATDVNTATTTYTYGSGTSCGNSFPTSVSSTTGGSVVTSLSTSSTWNCSGGVPLTSVDVNGNTTTYSYGSDPFWRPVSITNNATGAVTNYAYQTSSSNTSSTSMNFNGTTSTNTVVTTYDSLGRTLLQQTQQGQSSSSYDTVATAYDSIGRVAKQTLPYSGTLGNYVSTNPGSTTTYDALSRKTQVADSGGGTKSYTYSQNDVLVTVGPQVTSPATENLKKRNLEYNGAGWLASVCEVVTSTLPAGGTCGQTSSYTGYLTKYTYDGAGRLTQVKQNAQSSSVQTRTVAYDELGRKTSESIPEWSAGTGAAGTTNYYYDSVSGCTSSTGDLIKTVDPIGNATCITYDLLHRPTSSQVVSGSYASVTPLMYVVYDAATYSGTGMQNVKGQVAEAYTCSSSTCSSRLTDIFFSASPVTTGNMTGGVLSQMWEKTPNSGNYFLTQDTYFPNGAVGAVSASLGGSSIGIPSLTYGVDGEGRPYSATDTTNSLNLVTATAYNPASSPTSITYGNASTGSASDVDSFTYDSYTYRPTNITYAVNPNPSSSDYTVSTGLTWNANWSLQQMQYTDRNDSTKNQTCTYSADDLSRIASVNCSGAWGQTFAYDPFGNINKTGNNGGTSYAAAYNTVTNQVSSGVTASYDANGNQLTSTPATLTWNALNLPIQVNSTTATYDALGRMVEKGLSGVYTQFVYRPSGAMLAVYSGGLTKGTISLPGGSTAVYNTTGLNYIRHKDWLGSSRLATTWSTHGVYSKEAYAPFGESHNEAGTADRSFTGQDQNVATGPGGTGAYDFLFRKYDPSAGRWLSPDPTGWDVVNQADPQSLDRYAYVENRPVNWVDPYGLSPPCNGGLVSGEEDDEGGWPEVSPYLYVNWNSQNVPQDVPQFNCYNPWNPGNPTGTNSGAGGAPNNGKSKTACTVDNALAAVPGAAPNGINTPVNGHLEVGIDVSAATLQADGFQFFQTPFGPNGYRAGNVIISAHVNGSGSELSPASFQNAPNGIVTAQVHFDIFNPSTGLFGIIGHTIWDWLIGHLFAHSATLDPGC